MINKSSGKSEIKELTLSLKELESAVQGAFGVKWVDRFANSLDTVTSKTQKLTTVTKKSLKLAKADFDQLNQLAGGSSTQTTTTTTVTTEQAEEFDKVASIIKGLEDWIGSFSSEGVSILADALAAIGAVAAYVSPGLARLYNDFLKPIAQFTGGIAIAAIRALSSGLEGLASFLGFSSGSASDFIAVAGGIGSVLLSVAALVGGAELAFAAFGGVVAALATPAGAIAALILLIGGIVTAAGNAGEMIEALKLVLTGIGDFIVGVFTGDWKRAWLGVSNVFKGIWNGMVIVFESAVNVIITGINWLIERLNAISFDIPEWVPGIGGLTYGINIPPVSKISLPRLAAGAVIPAGSEFLAVLGDQTSGRNLEAPESLIRQIVREESGAGTTVRLAFTGSLSELGRVLKPVIDSESKRVGTRLVVEG